MRIFLDTSILIELEKKNEEALKLIEAMTSNYEELMISSVTVSEILKGAYFLGGENVVAAKTFLSQFNIISLDAKIAEKTSQFTHWMLKNESKANFKTVAIAATFAETKADFLITQDKRHFEILPEIGSKAKTTSEFRKIYR